MWWRVPKGGKTWEEAKGAKNRERFRKLFRAGEVHGVLAFDGAEPAGWCSIGPRETFPRIESIKAIRGAAPAQTWAVICFYIPSRWRGKGVATALLQAAKDLAFERGARAVEGYPMVPASKSAKMPAAFAWTGVPEVFRRAGFTKGAGGTATRPIYRAKENS